MDRWEHRLHCTLGLAFAGTVAGGLVACSSSDPPPSSPADGGLSDAGDAGVTSLRVTPTTLIADTSDAGAQHVGPDLVNAWGLAFSTGGVAWISDNGTGRATLFPPNADGGALASILVPPAAEPAVEVANAGNGGDAGDAGDAGVVADAGEAGVVGDAAAAAATAMAASPTGIVANPNSSAFLGDVFITATEDGTIAGWQPSSPASFRTRVDESAQSAAVFKGLAIVPTSPPLLLAANFRGGAIDVFDSSYEQQQDPKDAGTGAWVDRDIPAGYAPFNVVTIGQNVYVSYALQDSAKVDDVPGLGQGAVSVFDFAGNLVKSLIPVTSGGPLDAPWGMAIAPATWAPLAGTLLVGNFGAGDVNAFSLTTGARVGTLVSSTTNLPLVIDGLWSLVFGDDADAGVSPNALYFTAGPNMEKNGRYGVLTLVQ